MESAPGMDVTLDPQDSFKIGYNYLKSRIEYIFTSPRMKPDTWRVAYWSVKVQRSSIMKFGTEDDKSRLPPENKRNKTRQARNRTSSDGRQVKRRRSRKNAPVMQPQVQEATPRIEPQVQEATPEVLVQEDEAAITPRIQEPTRIVVVTQEPTSTATAVVTQEPAPTAVVAQEPRRLRKRPPVHGLMKQRKSTRKKRQTVVTKKKKQTNNPSNKFAAAFTDIQVEFVQKASESSQPPQVATSVPPKPSRSTQRRILPGMCGGCGKPVSSIHTCDVCNHNMHVFCGLPIGDEGYGQKIRCPPCQRALE